MDGKNDTFIEYFKVVINQRKSVLRNTIIITIIAIIVSFLLTPQFTATATILPPGTEQTTSLDLTVGGLSTGNAGIPALSSILPGLATPSDLYTAIMKSGKVRSRIIKQFNLKQKFKTRTMYDTHKKLTDITQIKISPEGIISISVTYRDKYLATKIANAYIEELDKFNKEISITSAKKYRLFIEKRLKEAEDSLARAEETLKNFQKKNRTVALDTEIKKVIETIASLKSRVILKEVQKKAVSGIDNPYIQSIERELREMRKQLAKIEFGSKTKKRDEFGAGFSIPLSELPEVSLEYARLLRDVKVQEAVYELLAQQYEQARIMEVKDTPTVQILDKARIPEKKSSPNRRLIALLALYCAVTFSVMYAITFHRYSKSDSKNALKRFINEIHRDFKHTRTIIHSFMKRSA
ncbi:MAG TPA: hypothetical protein ENI34_08140 [candidate division WOR-3 bacterium]|uniref:Tyrosine kinase G-rich domain-containing protein n=1 Tax=candidate division WOR-3 bacterium TaxID=2052148 RepID=A0A9C9K0I1_UNCW3|nr:hypothetical protein [candidate division WOR-3 bacterium]